LDAVSLWVPLCGNPGSPAKIGLKTRRLTATWPVDAVQAEGGIAAGAGSVWLLVDRQGTLARIDPASGAIRQTLKVAAGSFNPLFSAGQVWVTRAEGGSAVGWGQRP
jgi:streptogramin lyase